MMMATVEMMKIVHSNTQFICVNAMCIFVSVCCFPLIYKLEENGAQNPHSDRHGWILCIPEPDKSSWIRYFSSDSLRDPNLQGWRWRVGMLNYIFTKNQEERRKGGIGFAIRTCGIIRGSVKFKTGSVAFTKCIWMQKAKVFESETKSPILAFWVFFFHLHLRDEYGQGIQQRIFLSV